MHRHCACRLDDACLEILKANATISEAISGAATNCTDTSRSDPVQLAPAAWTTTARRCPNWPAVGSTWVTESSASRSYVPECPADFDMDGGVDVDDLPPSSPTIPSWAPPMTSTTVPRCGRPAGVTPAFGPAADTSLTRSEPSRRPPIHLRSSGLCGSSSPCGT